MKNIIIIILLLFFIFSGLFYAYSNSITTDEKTHITAGYINIFFNDYRFNIEHPPFLKQISALPLLFINLNFPADILGYYAENSDITKIQDIFLFKSGNNLNKIAFVARLPAIFIAALMGLFVFLFSRQLNGFSAGLVSLLCFVFSPNFLAHSSLVTMDTAVSCFYFLMIFFLMQFFISKKQFYAILTGLFLGLSLATKYSALSLIPLLYLVFFLIAFNRHYPLDSFKKRIQLKEFFILILPLILVCSYKYSLKIILPAVILYFLSFLPFINEKTREKLAFIGRYIMIILTITFIIVILDYTDYKWFPFHSATKSYFKGLAYFAGHARGGHLSYFMGSYSDMGKWYYFPAAILLKTPIPTLIYIALGIGAIIIAGLKDFRLIFVILPALVYLFIACFINKVNIGIRHILPVYPFLYVMAGYSIVLFKRLSSKTLRCLFLIPVFWLIAESITAFPGHISYFNQIAGGSRNGHRFLGDSNVAWGQDYKRLRKYIVDNNINSVIMATRFGSELEYNYYDIPYKTISETQKQRPTPGVYVTDGIILQISDIKWLKKIKPTDRVGGSLLIYEVK